MCAVSCHKWIVTKFVMERQSLTVQRQSQDAVNHNSRTVLTFVMEQVAQTGTSDTVMTLISRNSTCCQSAVIDCFNDCNGNAVRDFLNTCCYPGQLDRCGRCNGNGICGNETVTRYNTLTMTMTLSVAAPLPLKPLQQEKPMHKVSQMTVLLAVTIPL